MGKRNNWTRLLWFLCSRRAMVIPVTFLMLFVSLTVLVSATYYFSMTKISTKASAFKTSGAEQEMLSLEKVIKSVTWAPGAYEIYEFGDFGGQLKFQPATNRLILNLTDGSSFYDVFFNSSVGKIGYELATSEVYNEVYFIGDARPIVNQSSSTMTQLGISHGKEHYEITLSYRPQVGSTSTGSSGGKPVNSIRIYLISLNSSQNIARFGNFRLKISCLNVASSWNSFDFAGPISSLLLKADLNGTAGQVSLQISSSALGATVNLETVVCNIKMEEVGW